MRNAVIAGCLVAGICVAWIGVRPLAPAAHGEPTSVFQPDGGGVVAIKLAADALGERIVVIDPRTQAMAVYRIGKEKGEIQLESMRPLKWDLQMIGYNSESPSAEEVRLGLERR